MDFQYSTALADQLWDDEIWDELLAYIEEERVVPIIGPHLSRVEIDGRLTTIEAHVARELARKLIITSAELPPDYALNDVVQAHLRRGGRREALYPRIRGIMLEGDFAPSPDLRRLAGISHFKLFVTTTFDNLMEQAINEVRFGGRQVTSGIGYAPNNVRDIDGGQATLATPVVYHLLGSLSASPSYVISDEDLLEFVCSLQSDDRHPSRLFDELENSHLLFLGSTFSDWLSRLFLRTAKRRRLSDPRDVLEIMADDRTRADSSLVAFLASYSTRTKVFRGDDATFIDELWTRWSAKFSNEAQARQTSVATAVLSEMPDNAIFISYAREDFAAVRQLKLGLETAGLPVWFDTERLNIGDAYDLKIRNNIKHCTLFMPVLSRNTDRRLEGFFRREWRYALDRDMNIDSSVPFIVPIVIDATGRGDLRRVPPRFLELHLQSLPGGDVTLEFAAMLGRQVKHARQT